MKGSSLSMIFACLISWTRFIAPPESQLQLQAALPSSRTQICQGTVTSHPAFRFSRYALITGRPGRKTSSGDKEKERKNERGVARLSTPTLQSPLLLCVYACVSRVRLCCMGSHTHDRCDREGIRRDVRCVSANAGTITSDSGAATCVITICHVCVCA